MPGRVVVAGMGPAGPELMTAGTMACIERIPRRFVRTSRHPTAAAVPGAVSFDEVYEQATSLEEVYSTIVERLVSAAGEHGEVLYLVPGSPTVAERSVELLRHDDAPLHYGAASGAGVGESTSFGALRPMSGPDCTNSP